MKKLNKGFTLIELLVVISIIAILVSIGFVSFAGTQKQARDSVRKSDIKQYQNALEVFANQNSSIYPSRTAASGVQLSVIVCGDLSLSSCPEDTRFDDDSSHVYLYQSNGSDAGVVDATQYVLWAKLENTTDYWVVCSNGSVGTKAQAGFTVVGGACPL